MAAKKKAKKKTPTLAQVRKLAREKLGDVAQAIVGTSLGTWRASAFRAGLIAPHFEIWAPSRSAALRALYAALEAL